MIKCDAYRKRSECPECGGDRLLMDDNRIECMDCYHVLWRSEEKRRPGESFGWRGH